MARYGVFAHTRLEPLQIELIAGLSKEYRSFETMILEYKKLGIYSVHWNSGLEIVNTAQYQVNRAIGKTMSGYDFHEMIKVFYERYVVIENFNFNIGVDVPWKANQIIQVCRVRDSQYEVWLLQGQLGCFHFTQTSLMGLIEQTVHIC